MKNILVGIFTLLFAHIGLAQKGIYQDTHFSFGSNLLSNEMAMSQIHLDLGLSYSFSEKFRLGFILEYGHTSFRDALCLQEWGLAVISGSTAMRLFPCVQKLILC